MEINILKKIEWDLVVPTPLIFFRRFAKVSQADSHLKNLGKYIMEVSLPEYTMLKFVPSIVASSALFLSRKIVSKQPIWTKALQQCTGYSVEDLEACLECLKRVLQKEGTRYSITEERVGLRPATTKYQASNIAPLVLAYFSPVMDIETNQTSTQPELV
mmetsp:Transcript_11716/g.15581  ORF Transcript_11716/g.15581 Transcript_11716/m.15581 type:complete len:159 (+) Transcript_11716:1-477(+)